MSETYEGILKDDRISWKKGRPSSADAVRVRITVVEEGPDSNERGALMAAALRAIADQGGISAIDDPLAWQHDQRSERDLPGRGE